MAGIVDTSELIRFKRMIFRATKGNNWTITKSLETMNVLENDFDISKEDQEGVVGIKRSVFMIVY